MPKINNGRPILGLPYIVQLAFFLFLFSCGSDLDRDNPVTPVPQEEEEFQAEGLYKAVLLPLNRQPTLNSSGNASFIIEGDEVTGSIIMNNVSSGIEHYQFIHSDISSSCPESSDDINSDGYIDISEAIRKSGDVLIPLDDEVDSTNGQFPVGNSEQNYFWNGKASYSQMESDFMSTDNLQLEGRAIIIYGAAPNLALPDSVNASIENNRNLSLPVACGVIQKVE